MDFNSILGSDAKKCQQLEKLWRRRNSEKRKNPMLDWMHFGVADRLHV
jgi:hypothetical protein